MASNDNEGSMLEEYLTCSLCLETFRNPKLLPCAHTFCEVCLKDLVSNHPSGNFPCPTCRQDIQVPENGVSAFKNNIYIRPEELQRASSGSFCSKHPKKEIELYCQQCDVMICVTCLVTKHNQHKAEDISDATDRLKEQLDKAKERLQGGMKDVQQQVKVVTQDQQAVKDKHAALVADIRNRQATLKAAVDKYTDQALASLDKITADISTTQQADLDSLQHNLQELTKLEQRVQQALDSGSGCELVTVAREMRCGRGSEEAVHKLTTKPMTTVCRPVLHFSATADVTLQRMRDYMCSAAKMEMAVSAPEVTVDERFRCRDDPDTDVYHVCPLTNGNVVVCYEPHVMHSSVANEERFNTEGKVVKSMKRDPPSRVTHARRKNGRGMYRPPSQDWFCTHAKRSEPDLVRYLRLENNYKGTSDVTVDKIVSQDPFDTESKTQFTINSTLHRAFDVDASEQNFVVLQEAQTPHTQRTVRLYRHSQPDAIHTYSPPGQPFQPSDVCFYRLGGQEVLLVADELNDAIHVVKVQNGRLSFARYLAPGCPLLVQPTALNTDIDGRLWVACRGGRILTCTPVS